MVGTYRAIIFSPPTLYATMNDPAPASPLPDTQTTLMAAIRTIGRGNIKKFCGNVCLPWTPPVPLGGAADAAQVDDEGKKWQWRETGVAVDMWWVRELVHGGPEHADNDDKTNGLPADAARARIDEILAKRIDITGVDWKGRVAECAELSALCAALRVFRKVADLLLHTDAMPTVSDAELWVDPRIVALRLASPLAAAADLVPGAGERRPPHVVSHREWEELRRIVPHAAVVHTFNEPIEMTFPLEHCEAALMRGAHGLVLVEAQEAAFAGPAYVGAPPGDTLRQALALARREPLTVHRRFRTPLLVQDFAGLVLFKLVP